MRALHLAIIGALLAIPSVGYSQDNGPVGGKVGPNLESAPPPPPGSLSTQPYGSPPPAGRPAGFAGAVTPGQVVPHNVVPRWGGVGSAFVGGHRVLVDPSSNRILRVLD
jgi:hypothetical protein